MQPVECIKLGQVRKTHRPDRLQRPAARENTEATQQRLLRRSQQGVAPGDRVAQRAQTRRRVTCATRQQSKAAVQPFEQRRRRQHSQPRRGQLDGQGQSVQLARDLQQAGGVVIGQLELPARCARPRKQELHRFGSIQVVASVAGRRAERWHGQEVLADDLQRAVGWLPGRTSRVHAASKRGNERCRFEQVLEVVEHEQHAPLADARRQAATAWDVSGSGTPRAAATTGGTSAASRIGASDTKTLPSERNLL